MSCRYYGLMLALAASLSAMLAGCAPNRSSQGAADPVTGAAPRPVQQASSNSLDTEATLWTLLGFAKRSADRDVGPHTGTTVSPVLWQAALETMHFAGEEAEDADSGLLVTKWYSPPAKPSERLRVSVFILSRALRSDSLAVTVERQIRSPDGTWQGTPVARDVVDGLESAILQRARQIHAERYRNTMYN